LKPPHLFCCYVSNKLSNAIARQSSIDHITVFGWLTLFGRNRVLSGRVISFQSIDALFDMNEFFANLLFRCAAYLFNHFDFFDYFVMANSKTGNVIRITPKITAKPAIM
jgi:hypothetical protein